MHTNEEKQGLARNRMTRLESKFSKLKSIKREAIKLGEVEVVRTGYLNADSNLPLLFRPASPDADLIAWASLNRPLLEAHLLRLGALLFRGFALDSIRDFQRFAEVVCDGLYDRYGDLPRESQGGKVYSSTPYPASETILFHNESSHQRFWPMKILFHCVKAAREGGETPIADCRRVLGRMSARLREKFRSRGLMYVRNFGEGVDVRWEEFYKSESRQEVERQCRSSGTRWEWKADGGLRTRQVVEAVRRHPRTGEEVYFSQGHLRHVSCLREEVRRSVEGVFGEQDLPRNVYWGDGGEIKEEEVREVGELYEEEAESFVWEEGDVLLVDNMLVAHGRRAYEGERKIVVSMGEMMRVGGREQEQGEKEEGGEQE